MARASNAAQRRAMSHTAIFPNKNLCQQTYAGNMISEFATGNSFLSL
jgi:hypothetical protein